MASISCFFTMFSPLLCENVKPAKSFDYEDGHHGQEEQERQNVAHGELLGLCVAMGLV